MPLKKDGTDISFLPCSVPGLTHIQGAMWSAVKQSGCRAGKNLCIELDLHLKDIDYILLKTVLESCWQEDEQHIDRVAFSNRQDLSLL